MPDRRIEIERDIERLTSSLNIANVLGERETIDIFQSRINVLNNELNTIENTPADTQSTNNFVNLDFGTAGSITVEQQALTTRVRSNRRNPVTWPGTMLGNMLSTEDFSVKKAFIPDDDYKIDLYIGGTAKYKDCMQTKCGRWFLKDDTENVITCVYDEYQYYIGDCVPIITKFNDKGIPIMKDDTGIKYVYRGNEKYLSTIIVTFKKELHLYPIQYINIPLNFYRECIEEGVFYHINDYPEKPNQAVYRKVNIIKDKKTLDLAGLYKYGIKSPTYNRTEGKRYSYGLEFETSLGILPSHLDSELSYQAVHDGSLRDPKTDLVLGKKKKS